MHTSIHMQAAIEPSSLKGRLPTVAKLYNSDESSTSPDVIVDDFLAAFAAGVAERDIAKIRNLFTEDSLWRDSLALTGTFRTFHQGDTIAPTLLYLAAKKATVHFRINKNPHLKPKVVNITSTLQWIEGSFLFDVGNPHPASCSGGYRLYRSDDGIWRAWTLYTLLENFEGYPEIDPTTNSPPEMMKSPKEVAATSATPGLVNGAINQTPVEATNEKTYNGTNGRATTSEGSVIDVLIIGAGQSGLSLAGRCKGYGLSYLVIDKNKSIGDNWLNRYESVKLHTPKLWSAPPYMATAAADPEFLTRTHLASMLKRYQKLLDLNVSLSTVVESASFHPQTQLWSFTLLQGSEISTGLKAKHVVFAIGSSSQVPFTPELPDRKSFKGEVVHSVDFWNGQKYAAKRVAVIGTANTAHDVAQDLFDAGAAQVTMVQRSPTYVLPAEYLCQYYASYYNDTLPIEVADRMTNPGPMAAGRHLAMMLFNGSSRKEIPRFEALANAGFKVIREGDLFVHIYGRGGGHYIDVGTSRVIAQGGIKVKSDSLMTSYGPDGLLFEDGSRLDCDAVIFCTGFKDIDMVPHAAAIVGAENLTSCCGTNGLNEEGEFRNQWKSSGHPSAWFMPGNVGTARYWSRLVALQILADVKGFRLPVYSGSASL